MNKKIGLIGEDPNDTSSIRNLLKQKFNSNISFITLIRNKRGNQLDNERTKVALDIEYNRHKPDILIFIRDADGLITHNSKVEKCINWFNNISKDIECKKALLVNIWELEALIFADIDAFNKIYKTNIKSGRNVTFISDPKNILIEKTKKLNHKYSVSDCPTIFEKINIDTVCVNCKYFKEFIEVISGFLKTI